LRKKLDVVPSRHHTRPVPIGAAVVVISVIALYSAATHNIPILFGKHGESVKIEFAAANQVSKRTVVRVGGIDVGRVDKVEAGSDPRRTSVATVQITNDDVKLHNDARAEIRWRTLFGGLMYIDLHPGSASAPELGGSTIPASRTSTQVELDQFLQPYDGTTADAQRGVIRGLRDSFADPDGVGVTLRTLAPTLTTVEQGTKPLRGREADDLRKLVASTSKAVKGLDDTPALAALVTGASRTLTQTDLRRRELGEFIELSPSSLDSTLTTMRRIHTTLDHLDPLASALRPGARALGPSARSAIPAFQQTEDLLREARPLLRYAGPTFDALRRASASGVPLMEGLDPTLARLDKQTLPYLRKEDPDAKLKVYEMIGPFWASLANAASEYDAEGYRIRFTVPPGANSLISRPPTDGVAP
jgi:phospholipid/cholesterol/gamma-HCH transport system substrate-binding protein